MFPEFERKDEAEETAADALARKRASRTNWRLGRLLTAYGDSGRILEADEMTALEHLADGREDLWAICAALRRGCTIEQAGAIWAPLGEENA